MAFAFVSFSHVPCLGVQGSPRIDQLGRKDGECSVRAGRLSLQQIATINW